MTEGRFSVIFMWRIHLTATQNKLVRLGAQHILRRNPQGSCRGYRSPGIGCSFRGRICQLVDIWTVGRN
jgi:hypothetical protein